MVGVELSELGIKSFFTTCGIEYCKKSVEGIEYFEVRMYVVIKSVSRPDLYIT